MPPKFSRELQETTISDGYISYQLRTSPCEASCPAGNPIQKMNSLVKDNQFEEALEYLRSRNPFPGICGRVCPHFCEDKCNRNYYDEGLSIRAIERAVATYADMTRISKPRRKEQTECKVAVIGAGPAGMTAAYFLALFGHEVVIFESSSSLGGTPRQCIPDYRLPKDVVVREIGQVLELGVVARTNTLVGRDISLEKIREDFDACLIATGAWKENGLNIPGNQLSEFGLSFLKQATSGKRAMEEDKVVIIGGGGVAFDCAFTARRLGAKEVHIFCLEKKDCMVVNQDDIEQSCAEAITIHNEVTISNIRHDNGRVIGIECFNVESFQFDQAGKAQIIPVSGSERSYDADMVIVAVGQTPDLSFLGETQCELTEKGALAIDPATMSTSIEGVFAAGDVASGPKSVAEAIGNGRRAALAIDNYLLARPNANYQVTLDPEKNIVFAENEHKQSPHIVEFAELIHVDYFDKQPRQEFRKLSAEKAVEGFSEVNDVLSRDQAIAEAERCFHCGHCFQCNSCVEDCPGYVLAMGDTGPLVKYPEECWHCGNCRISCPCGAVSYDFPISMLV